MGGGRAVRQRKMDRDGHRRTRRRRARRFDRPILHGTDTLDPRSDMFGACFSRAATTFDKNGKAIPGYRWVRRPGSPDLWC